MFEGQTNSDDDFYRPRTLTCFRVRRRAEVPIYIYIYNAGFPLSPGYTSPKWQNDGRRAVPVAFRRNVVSFVLDEISPRPDYRYCIRTNRRLRLTSSAGCRPDKHGRRDVARETNDFETNWVRATDTLKFRKGSANDRARDVFG